VNKFNSCQIHWKDGDLIKALHFQLNDSYFQSLLTPFYQIVPYFWGVKELEFEEQNAQKITIKKGEFIFQDNTYALLNHNSICVPRSIDIDKYKNKEVMIYIGIKKNKDFVNNVTQYESLSGVNNPKTRFISVPQEADNTKKNMEDKVKILYHVLELILEDEKINIEDEYQLIPIAICSIKEEVITYKEFCPPVLHINKQNSFLLYNSIEKIIKLIQEKIEKLEKERNELWFQYSKFSKTNINYLLFLNLLKRYMSVIEHSFASEKIHPWSMYGILKTFIYEMSTFNTNICIKTLKEYKHSDILTCFSSIYDLISDLLESTYNKSISIYLKKDFASYFKYVDDIIQITQEKIDKLEKGKKEGGIQSCDFSSTNINCFLFLTLLKRYLPIVEHAHKIEKVHPIVMYGILKEYVYVMTTFTNSVNVNTLPNYQDSEIRQCFSQAYDLISKILSNVCFTIWIHLKKDLNSDYYYTNKIQFEKFDKGEIFELILKTKTNSKHMPKEDINSFFKITFQKDIENYLTIKGKIELKYLYEEKQKDNFYSYFYRLENSDIWEEITKSPYIAFHWRNAPKDLEVIFRIVGN